MNPRRDLVQVLTGLRSLEEEYRRDLGSFPAVPSREASCPVHRRLRIPKVPWNSFFKSAAVVAFKSASTHEGRMMDAYVIRYERFLIL